MILITGATGLLGSQISRDLLKDGIAFKALYRGNIPAHMQDIADQIDWVEGDLLDITAVNLAMEGIDTVIHCAALVSFARQDKSRLYQVNVETTKNLVDAALTHSARNFIYFSSTGALPKTAVRDELDESRKWESSELNTYYGYTKYLGELEVWRGGEEGLKTLILNPCVILGPGEPGRSSRRLFDYVLKESRFITDGLVSYVDVRDISDILRSLLRQEIFGERFILCAGNMDYEMFFQRMAHHLGKKPPSIRINSTYVQIFAWLESLRATLTGSKPLITRETAIQTRLRITFNNSKIRKKLGYEFRDLEDTLAWCSKQILKK